MNPDWIAIHIFYASDSNPVLVECLRPLVRQLQRDSLIRRYFFIKYWMEGPHVRLRLLTTTPDYAEAVMAVAEPQITQFLKRRPALYEVDHESIRPHYKQMFIAEYGEAAWIQSYGEEGQMPFRPNNSHDVFPYEPEYGRYGGPEGVELAEWHFEHSSDVVLDLLGRANVHVRPVLLGLGAQLELPLLYTFLETDERVVEFLGNYMQFWQDTFGEDTSDRYPSFDRKYDRMATSLQDRVAQVRRIVFEGSLGGQTERERRWVEHIRELKLEVENLATAGKLRFSRASDPGGGEPTVVDDIGTAASILLSSYVHMTNNRLGVSILDEIYLSYVLRKSILAMADGAGQLTG